ISHPPTSTPFPYTTLFRSLPKQQVEELVLEEVPDISYEDIGGLGTQIQAIRDAVELPFLYAELFHEHQLKPPKGVLLYGPPGCRSEEHTSELQSRGQLVCR